MIETSVHAQHGIKHTFRCSRSDCYEQATWLSWYSTSGGLYNYFCADHAAIEIKQNYNLVCLRAISDAIKNVDKNEQISV